MLKSLISKRLYSTTLNTAQPAKKSFNKWLWGGSIAVATAALYYQYQPSPDKVSYVMPEQTYVTVNDNIKQFPKYLYAKNAITEDGRPMESNEPYFNHNAILLGYGTRSLPISYFKVYSLGFYLDMVQRKKILESTKDTNSAEDIIADIIESGTPVTIKMTPLMNSNLTFIRETGLIKSIKNSPLLKDDTEQLEKCIEDVRRAYNYKHTLNVNDDLYMEFCKDHSVQFYYFNDKSKEFLTMGKTTEPLISTILLKTYLEGDNTMVPDAKKMFAENLFNP